MEQPVPEVTDGDVERVVCRDFPPEELPGVIAEDWRRYQE